LLAGEDVVVRNTDVDFLGTRSTWSGTSRTPEKPETAYILADHAERQHHDGKPRTEQDTMDLRAFVASFDFPVSQLRFRSLVPLWESGHLAR
jgi:hypothetical protein